MTELSDNNEIPGKSKEVSDLEKETDRQFEIIAEVERNKMKQELPMSEEEISQKLRQYGLPTYLYGESLMERYKRLKSHMDDIERAQGDATKPKDVAKAETHTTELWYHEGSEDLLTARIWLSHYSLGRVQERLNKERENTQRSDFEKASKFQDIQKRFRAFEYKSSQLGDDRPLTYCQISPDGKTIATASRSGVCRQWDISSLEKLRDFKGHTDHAGAIVFHPTLYESESDSVIQLASCCGGGNVLLWNTKKTDPIWRLANLGNRVSRVCFHPSGRFVGSACFDKTWRLFDLQKGVEVLQQEGHSRECFNLAFHVDGSLAVSAGFDARALVWDLRTGRCVLPLDGHLQKVVGVDIADDGYYVATGSDDQRVMIWDIRKQASVYTIAAHISLVSHVKFHDGCLITASFDKTCRIWSHPGWFPLRTLTGHEQKLSCAAISHDQSLIVTTSFDSTFKIWC